MERHAAHVLIELERCYPTVESPERWRSGRRTLSGPDGWPEYYEWAIRWRLTVEECSDGWLMVWAWGRRNRPWAPLEKSMTAFVELAGGCRSRDAQWCEIAAECFVRWQLLEEPWSGIARALTRRGVNITVDTVRSNAASVAGLLSMRLREGTRGGRPRKRT